ncbi:Holliday junction branch migration protein RuvA [Tessaracoccus defluvii]|uniref:Holliday junction branch migration complex subunit RuvA n=1 Tax=Tessaracoccus defluvii TaxID=1285901 RepID=A0A7H0H859_9ACTN|nr:Holliday junction branch migration protein RuvA [Tessaracoccus defluvii]QNP56725.1 Holliday junction branch migration protein RuvA [Tessaracoccus defluvii]
MIATLTGTVLTAGATSCVVDVSGVGFLLQVTPATAAGLRVGEKATLHTHLVVREDSLTLFGFADEDERSAFIIAQSASGVGPKLALAVVSVLSPTDLRLAITSADLARLTSVPGIGAKGAQRLVLELKDKVALLGAGTPAPAGGPAAGEPEVWRAQVTEGLQGLGWSLRDAEAAADTVAPLVDEDPTIGVGQLLRAALNSLARR